MGAGRAAACVPERSLGKKMILYIVSLMDAADEKTWRNVLVNESEAERVETAEAWIMHPSI